MQQRPIDAPVKKSNRIISVVRKRCRPKRTWKEEIRKEIKLLNLVGERVLNRTKHKKRILGV